MQKINLDLLKQAQAEWQKEDSSESLQDGTKVIAEFHGENVPEVLLALVGSLVNSDPERAQQFLLVTLAGYLQIGRHLGHLEASQTEPGKSETAG